ncbi:DUF6801 domain-containing protein [Nocardioides yefusunii]|uniref:DUF6801 domain-containing protein n=1 Tax=Nocardioides yefusunii TaxID=2500546 RepID=A0ABW1QY20_9ACTN|nr:DUF6801 domain-containing protein [Nocardioides yefusunii]
MLRIRRSFAALATSAVAASGLVALSPAASAAASDVPFNCALPFLGAKVFTVSADATFPAKVQAGKASSYEFVATVSIPDDVRRDARGLLGEKVSGSATVPSTLGSQALTVAATIPTVEIPTTEGPLVVQVKGKGNFVAPAAGTAAVTVKDFDAALVFNKNGVDGSPFKIKCSAASAVEIATVKVTAAPKAPVKATSKTTVKIAKKGKKATATVTVKVGKKAAAGKVSVSLKQGKKTKKVTVKLNAKGVGKATFSKLAKGKFTVKATYAGNAKTKGSKKSVMGKI